jgi:ELWxxDGT repeat protein
LTSIGQKVVFAAQDPDPPFQPSMWISDGTEAGTRRLLRTSSGGGTLETARLGSRTFFVVAGTDRGVGAELWQTDGTVEGTRPVIPDVNAPRPRDPYSLVLFQGALYFFAKTTEAEDSRGLWRSDGTAAGTRLIRAINPPLFTGNGILDYYRPLLTATAHDLFFRADDGVHGGELWRSDGTPEGTALVKDIAPGRAHSRADALTAAGDKVYFVASDGEHGTELWVSDGTEAGTHMVADLWPGPFSATPLQMLTAGGKLFFTADDGEHGRELWVLPLP